MKLFKIEFQKIFASNFVLSQTPRLHILPLNIQTGWYKANYDNINKDFNYKDFTYKDFTYKDFTYKDFNHNYFTYNTNKWDITWLLFTVTSAAICKQN